MGLPHQVGEPLETLQEEEEAEKKEKRTVTS